MTRMVICLDDADGDVQTRGDTNVIQLFRSLENVPGRQLTYYDPGVGTQSPAVAGTPTARRVSSLVGSTFGAGLRTNLEAAYTFLIEHWKPGDELFIFGFGRGGYCARALTGLLNMTGLLRPGSEHLATYAVSNYARRKPKWTYDDFLRTERFAAAASQEVDGHYWVPVTYLGLWDTVRAPGALRRSMEWPYTRTLPNITAGRHAVAVDEERRPFQEFLVAPCQQAVEEVWFPGTHSDIGGGFLEEPRLSDVALEWVVDGALAAGLLVRADRPLPSVTEQHATGIMHPGGWYWTLLAHRRRPVPADAKIHLSARRRIADDPHYARGRLPRNSWADPEWPR